MFNALFILISLAVGIGLMYLLGVGLMYVLEPVLLRCWLLCYFGTWSPKSPKIPARLQVLRQCLSGAHRMKDTARTALTEVAAAPIDVDGLEFPHLFMQWAGFRAGQWVHASDALLHAERVVAEAHRRLDAACGAAFIGGAGKAVARVMFK